jgi:hypothetical protein
MDTTVQASAYFGKFAGIQTFGVPLTAFGAGSREPSPRVQGGLGPAGFNP